MTHKQFESEFSRILFQRIEQAKKKDRVRVARALYGEIARWRASNQLHLTPKEAETVVDEMRKILWRVGIDDVQERTDDDND